MDEIDVEKHYPSLNGARSDKIENFIIFAKSDSVMIEAGEKGWLVSFPSVVSAHHIMRMNGFALVSHFAMKQSWIALCSMKI